jgi:hypothetical protein
MTADVESPGEKIIFDIGFTTCGKSSVPAEATMISLRAPQT